MIWLLLLAAQADFDSEARICQAATEERPLTLCLSEREFDRSVVHLNKQWRATLRTTQIEKGHAAAQTLRVQQRRWLTQRDRQCNAFAAPTPPSQQGRNWMSCASAKTDSRVAQLKAMIGKR